MESHREPKWCCVSSLTKIVTFFAVPFWSMPVLPRPPAPGRHPPGRDGYVSQHNAARAGCKGEWAMFCDLRVATFSECDSMQAAPLLDDEHVAAHGACQVVGRATPDMLVDSGMSREADDQQIDGILPHEIANYLDGMSGHNHGFEVHGVQRRARLAALGKLPEVAVGAILLFAKFVDQLGVAGNLLLHADHAKVRANPRCEFDGE